MPLFYYNKQNSANTVKTQHIFPADGSGVTTPALSLAYMETSTVYFCNLLRKMCPHDMIQHHKKGVVSMPGQLAN